MLPAPIVLPNDHSPVWAPIVVRLLAGPVLPEAFPESTGLAAAGTCNAGSLAKVVASDMRELLRETPGLDEGRLESLVDSDRFGAVSTC